MTAKGLAPNRTIPGNTGKRMPVVEETSWAQTTKPRGQSRGLCPGGSRRTDESNQIQE